MIPEKDYDDGDAYWKLSILQYDECNTYIPEITASATNSSSIETEKTSSMLNWTLTYPRYHKTKISGLLIITAMMLKSSFVSRLTYKLAR